MLAYLREHADRDGCCPSPRAAIAQALAVSGSTVQLAIAGLEEAGLIHIDGRRPGVANAYCLTPGTSTDPPETSTDTPTDRPTPTLTDSSRAPTSGRGGSPPTPSPVVSGSPDPEGTARDFDRSTDTSTDRPTSVEVVPLGVAASAAVVDAARAAGREPVANLGRVGKAAKDLEASGVDVATILAAAARMGAAGTTDLRTAVDAIEQGRAMPASAVERPAEGSRLAAVFRALRSTWPRIVIDAPFWEEKLEKIPERFLLAAVDRLAKEGGEFPPHWGQVYKTAWRIGVDDTERRRSAEERADLRARVRAIEES